MIQKQDLSYYYDGVCLQNSTKTAVMHKNSPVQTVFFCLIVRLHLFDNILIQKDNLKVGGTERKL